MLLSPSSVCPRRLKTVGREEVADVSWRHLPRAEVARGQPGGQDGRIGLERAIGSQVKVLLAGQHQHLREDRLQRSVGGRVAPYQLRAPVVLGGGQPERQDPAGSQDAAGLGEELGRVEAVERSSGGLRQVEDGDVKGAASRRDPLLDVQPTVGLDERDPRVLSEHRDLVGGQVGLGCADQQGGLAPRR